MSPIKVSLTVVALVLLIASAALISVLWLFDANEYREEISQFVQDETGRELSIDGDLGLRLLPCCAVALDGARLGNPPAFKTGDFASIESVRLGIQLWPLLTEQLVVVDEVRFDGLRLNLISLADGTTNWTFGVASAPTATLAADDSPTAAPELSVAGIRMTDASVSYTDEADGTRLRISDLNLETGALSLGQPFDFESTFVAEDLASDTRVRGSLNATALVSANAVNATLTAVRATADITTPDLPEGGLAADLNGERIDIDTASGAVAIDSLKAELSAAGVQLNIGVGGYIGAKGIDLNGTLALPAIVPRDLIARLGEQIDTADPSVLGTLQLDAAWSLDDTRLNVTSLNMQLDETGVTGQVGLNYVDQTDVSFNVRIDSIDVDRYLAPVVESDAPAPGKTSPAEAGAEESLPVEMIRSLDLEGRFEIDDLRVNGLSGQNVVVRIRAKDGLLRVDPILGSVYGGKFAGTLSLDATGRALKVKTTQQLESVKVGGLLQDLYDAQNLQGLLQAKVEAQGSGRTTGQLLKNLNGAVAMNLDDAVYEGIDVWYEIRKAVASVKGKSQPTPAAVQNTEITALEFIGNFSGGSLVSEKLVAEIPFIRLTGGGAVNLVDENIDYRLSAQVLSRPNFPDADELEYLQRIKIPMTVTGTMTDPSIGIDLAELAKDAAVIKVQDRLLKKLGLDESQSDENGDENGNSKSESTRDVLKKGLRDLFGN
jgi:AsmA protein